MKVSSLLAPKAVRHILSAILLAAHFFCLGTVAAQDDAARIATQEDILRRGDEDVDRPSIEINAGDPDLGEINVVRRVPSPKMFNFSTQQNLAFTTNAFLEPSADSTFFWNGRFDATFIPYATRNFTPSLTYEQNFFRYDRFSELDFDANSLEVAIKHDLNPDDTWFLRGSYAIARLYSPRDDEGEFYRYGLFGASINHLRRLGDCPVDMAASAGTTFRHGDPNDFNRATVHVAAAFRYSPLERVLLTAFVRPEVHFYTDDPDDSDRTDLNFSTGAAIIVLPTDYFSIAFTGSYVGNYSSDDDEDYDVFTPSFVLEGRVAF